jgi:hypothetical protein
MWRGLSLSHGSARANSDVLKKRNPESHSVPFVMTCVTYARFFSKLGIQTYGYTSKQLPSGYKFAELAHAANQRIPIEASDFGTQEIFEVLHRFGETII